MAAKLEPGNRVRWDTPQGETHGKVVREVKSKTGVKGHLPKPIRGIRNTLSKARRPEPAQRTSRTH